METKYTLEYFIEKLSAIPEEEWTTKTYNDGEKCCALGHCGAVMSCYDTEESSALKRISVINCKEENNWLTIPDVNDGKKHSEQYGTTPTERVVNYLKSLRDGKDKNQEG
jgi:hypothetical protein